MPKVYTRAVFSSSDHAKPTASSRAVLRTYYCLCGDFALVLQGKLERLPRRRHDGASIVRSRQGRMGQSARKFKLNVKAGERVVVRRTDGQLEPRQPFNCARCGTQRDAPFVYILKGALTEHQGRLPPDAFDGEDDVPEEGEGSAPAEEAESKR